MLLNLLANLRLLRNHQAIIGLGSKSSMLGPSKQILIKSFKWRLPKRFRDGVLSKCIRLNPRSHSEVSSGTIKYNTTINQTETQSEIRQKRSQKTDRNAVRNQTETQSEIRLRTQPEITQKRSQKSHRNAVKNQTENAARNQTETQSEIRLRTQPEIRQKRSQKTD